MLAMALTTVELTPKMMKRWYGMQLSYFFYIYLIIIICRTFIMLKASPILRES